LAGKDANNSNKVRFLKYIMLMLLT